MFSKISVQGLILVIQCALIAWLFSALFMQGGQANQKSTLLTIPRDSISSISISDGEGQQVRLVRQSGQWTLPDYHQLAANGGVVSELLDSLGEARLDWPVAQTEDAAARFHVAASNAVRHLQIQDSHGKSEDIYLGDSPGLRKLYVRKGTDAAIYSINLGLHLAPASARQWFDKALLKPAGTVSRVNTDGWELVKQGDDWTLQDLPTAQTLDQDRVINLVNFFQYPQVQAVASDEQVRALAELKPRAQYRVLAGEQSIDYQLFKVGDQYLLKSSLSELYFTVAEFVVKTIVEVDRDSLITETPQASTAEEIPDAEFSNTAPSFSSP